MGDKKGNSISTSKIGIPKIVLNAQAVDMDEDSTEEYVRNGESSGVFVIKDLNERVTKDFLDNFVSTKHLRGDKDDADNTLKTILRTMDGSQSDSGAKNKEFEERSKYDGEEDDCDSSEFMSSDEDYQPSTATKQRQRIGKGNTRSCRKPRNRCIKACYSTYRSVCRYYACSRGMRSMFRYKCKSNCKYQMDSWY